jgi:CRISPR-associated protein Cmr4
LQQFLRDSGCNLELPKTIAKDGALVCATCSLGTPLGANNKTKVILEEYDLSLMPDQKVEEIAIWIATKLFESNKEWQDIFKQRFAIVPEDLFNHFCLTGTEVVTRVRIDEEKGVAADGQLWTEESLPVGTILTSSIECDKRIGDEKEQNRLLDLYANKETSVQMGGKASVGRGRVRCVFTNL